MLSQTERELIVLQNEGSILHSCVHHGGKSRAGQVARAVVDGVMNALIRLEGSKEAAAFAFVLADRVAGGVRAPTAQAPLVEAPVPAIATGGPGEAPHWPWQLSFASRRRAGRVAFAVAMLALGYALGSL